ncbi:hypothetical protein ACFY19_17825 [Streptosporangium saharense]|uniref:Lactococcin 972 family bacteriocin n=1 Tax=Streptosporangium saharense TaxID=1706840 RepID=A0A7W7QPA8_9ACTN|nr:hypothetical protein [Streptosporangium saharense]MBB4917290.1 hypothetical protein [Streptosporangium saharense]
MTALKRPILAAVFVMTLAAGSMIMGIQSAVAAGQSSSTGSDATYMAEQPPRVCATGDWFVEDVWRIGSDGKGHIGYYAYDYQGSYTAEGSVHRRYNVKFSSDDGYFNDAGAGAWSFACAKA